MELGGELLFGLSFSLLEFQLVKVVHPSAASHVDIIGNDSRLLEELNVIDLFVAHGNWLLQCKMNNSDQLIRSTGLEESMLHIGERNVHSEALSTNIGNTIFVNLKIADSLSTLKVWLYDNVFKCLLSSLNHLEWL